MTKEKKEKRQKKKRKKKTYSFDEMRTHIDIYGKMIHLSDGVGWSHAPIGSIKRLNILKEIVKRAENEFLEEFKDEKFCYIFDGLKKKSTGLNFLYFSDNF